MFFSSSKLLRLRLHYLNQRFLYSDVKKSSMEDWILTSDTSLFWQSGQAREITCWRFTRLGAIAETPFHIGTDTPPLSWPPLPSAFSIINSIRRYILRFLRSSEVPPLLFYSVTLSLFYTITIYAFPNHFSPSPYPPSYVIINVLSVFFSR